MPTLSPHYLTSNLLSGLTVAVDFARARVVDHSAIEAIDALALRCREAGA